LNVLESKTSYDFEELTEVCTLREKALREAIDGGTKRWGKWRYSADEPPSIDHHDGTAVYQIVLDRINTVGKLGDWLLHLSEKPRLTPEDLGYLVRAVEDLEQIGYHKIKGKGVA
jgi:hypothetical protein